MSLILNSDQVAARDFATRRLRAKERVTQLAGPAGTGKTTMLRAVMDAMQLPEFNPDWPEKGGIAVCAPTNKAAAILRSKGFQGASTVHTATSRPLVASADLVRALEEEYYRAKNDGDNVRAAELHEKLETALKPEFTGRVTDWSMADAIILDEASMVDEELATRLFDLQVPVLAVGDPFQLQPVQGICPFLNDLTASDTVVLTKIERQAEGSGIIKLATAIRNGEALPSGAIDASCRVIDLKDRRNQDIWLGSAPDKLFMSSDVILTGTNKNRYRANRRMRKLRFGFEPDTPPDSREPYISYTNNKWSGVFKNDAVELFDIRPVGPDFDALVRVPNDPQAKVNHHQDPWLVYGGHIREHAEETGWSFALHQHTAKRRQARIEVDFAYALTTHRVQGSEYPSVLVFEDNYVRRMPEQERRRWLYTAVTRGKSKVVLVRNSPWH